MTKLLAFFGGNVGAWVIGAAFLLVLGFGVSQMLLLSAAEVALSKEQIVSAGLRTAAAEARARVATLTKEASENARKVEAEKVEKAKEIVNAVDVEKSKTVAAVAAHRADVRGLRKQLADYAASSSGTGAGHANASTGLSAEQKAIGLGDVLATCTEEAVSDAGELEDLATQVRGLQGYWSLTGDHK